MFRIGEFSRLCGLSIDTLYHYENMKILIPSQIDKFTGYRFYEAKQFVIVNKILALKDANFSLDEIANMLSNNISTPTLIEMLEKKALSLEDNLNNEVNRLERLHTNIFLIKNGGIPLMNEITFKKVEPIHVASIRKEFNKSGFDENLETMWNDVNQYINMKGGKRTIPCMMLYHRGWWDLDDSVNLDVEVVEPVIKVFEGSEEVRVYELPSIAKVACIIHMGSFVTISKTFDALFEWIKKNKYSISGPIREIYHKGDWATTNPDEYITEIQVPVM